MAVNRKNIKGRGKILTLNKDTDKKGILKGIAITHGETNDGRGTSFTRDAFKSEVGKTVPLLKDHNRWDIGAIVGNVTFTKLDSDGLHFRAELNTKHPDVNNIIIPAIEDKSLTDVSIGGFWQAESKTEDGIDIVTEGTIDELSLVTFGAMDGAEVREVACANLPLADIDIKFNRLEAAERWKKYSNSIDSPSDLYKNGFLSVDYSSLGNFSSYNLQVVDIIDEMPYIIPEGLFIAALKLNTVGICSEQLQQVKDVIENKFSQMDIVSPFDNIGTTELKKLSKRQLEKLLCSRGFSNSVAKMLISNKANGSEQREVVDTNTDNVEVVNNGLNDIVGLLTKFNNGKGN